MSKASIADHSLEWHQLLTSAKRNVEDLPYLSELIAELQQIVDVIPKLEEKRLRLTAEKQQTSRDLDGFKSRARVVAARIRSGLRTRYGYSSEKLAEFGLRPRRRRLRDEQAEKAAMDKLSNGDPVS